MSEMNIVLVFICELWLELAWQTVSLSPWLYLSGRGLACILTNMHILVLSRACIFSYPLVSPHSVGCSFMLDYPLWLSRRRWWGECILASVVGAAWRGRAVHICCWLGPGPGSPPCIAERHEQKHYCDNTWLLFYSLPPFHVSQPAVHLVVSDIFLPAWSYLKHIATFPIS